MIIFYNTYDNHYAISKSKSVYCSHNKDWLYSKYELYGDLLYVICLKFKTFCLYRGRIYDLGKFHKKSHFTDEAFEYFKFKFDNGYLL